MVIQIVTFDGENKRTRTYRNIHRGNIGGIMEGFQYLRTYNKWGRMMELRGKCRVTIGAFGDAPYNVTGKNDD